MIFSIQNADTKNFIKICYPGSRNNPLMFSNEASEAEGFSNPRAVPKPSGRAAGFQPALELWPTDLQLACLSGNNGFESPKSWVICSPLRLFLILP
jgi:hypothetical protein